MPIAQITVSEKVLPALRGKSKELTDKIVQILSQDLFARPDLIQVVFTAAIAPVFGKEVLCQVFHRATEARTAEVRKAVADKLHDTLQHFTGHSVRVRLMSLESATIAASDTPETPE